MTQLVSDEVWRQLDPHAGQLPRPWSWRLRLAVIATVVLALVAGALWRSGTIVPRVEWARHAGSSWSMDPNKRQVGFAVVLRNDGWDSVEVIGAGRSGPGFELVEVHGEFPTVLEPGEEMDLWLDYPGHRLRRRPAGPWPVPVRVNRLWGVYTA